MTTQTENAVSTLRSRIDTLSNNEALRVIEFIDTLTAHKPNDDTIQAMEEALQISRDPNAKRYSSFSQLVEEVREEMLNEI